MIYKIVEKNNFIIGKIAFCYKLSNVDISFTNTYICSYKNYISKMLFTPQNLGRKTKNKGF